MADEKFTLPSRRQVLKLGLKGVGLVGGGALAHHYYDFRVMIWGEDGALNLGDESRGTTQEDVTSLYKSLYEKIAAEKEIARAKGRDFMILIGEDHVNRDSLLVNMLILDIAAKLDVKTYINEGGTTGKLQPLLMNLARYFPKNTPAAAVKHFSEIFEIDFILSTMKKESAKKHNMCVSMFAKSSLGMKCIAGDPLNPTYEANKNKNISEEEREAKMAEVNSMHVGSRVCLYGGYHLPYLYDAFKDKLHVLPLNTKNDRYAFKNSRERRLRSEFPSIILQGKEVVNPQDTFEFLLIASLTYDLEKAGIPENQKKLILRGATEAIYSEAKKLMEGRPAPFTR